MSDIPGFYYDAEKKKYFKIGAGFQPPKKEPVTLAKFSPIIDQTVNVTKTLKSAAIGQISSKSYKSDISKFLYQNDRFHKELPIGLHERLFIAPNGKIALVQTTESNRMIPPGISIIRLNQIDRYKGSRQPVDYQPFHGVNDLRMNDFQLSCVAFSTNDDQRTLCAVSIGTRNDYRLAFHNVDENGLSSPVAVTVCAGRGNIRDMAFIDKSSLLYTNGSLSQITRITSKKKCPEFITFWYNDDGKDCFYIAEAGDATHEIKRQVVAVLEAFGVGNDDS